MIDLADLERFPEAIYGSMVAPADKKAYDNSVAMVKGLGLPEAQLAGRLTGLLLTGKQGQPFLNAARIVALEVAFPDTTLMPLSEPEDDSYDQDFGVDMIPGNYSLFMGQRSPDSTSVGVWREGLTGSIFGRFARRFDAGAGKNMMTFSFDPALIGAGHHHVRLTVTILDKGAGAWSVHSQGVGGEQSTRVITNGNTGKAISHVFDIEELVGGGQLPDNGDFTLQHENGADTVFYLIEVQRLATHD